MERTRRQFLKMAAITALALGSTKLTGCYSESSDPKGEHDISQENFNKTIKWMTDQDDQGVYESAILLQEMRKQQVSGGFRAMFINSGTANEDYASVVNMGNDQGAIIIVLSADKFSQPDFSIKEAACSLHEAVTRFKHIQADPRY